MNDLIIIENKIHEIRGQKVMLDFDLAEMYEIETKRLKEQVRRNMERFPSDFLFQLTSEEVNALIFNIRSQNATLSKDWFRYAPFAFTEQGVAMLSGILRSPKAIEVNINIMRAFVRMRQYLLSHAPKQELEELRKRIEYLEEDISSDRGQLREAVRRTVLRLCQAQRCSPSEKRSTWQSRSQRIQKRRK